MLFLLPTVHRLSQIPLHSLKSIHLTALQPSQVCAWYIIPYYPKGKIDVKWEIQALKRIFGLCSSVIVRFSGLFCDYTGKREEELLWTLASVLKKKKKKGISFSNFLKLFKVTYKLSPLLTWMKSRVKTLKQISWRYLSK